MAYPQPPAPWSAPVVTWVRRIPCEVAPRWSAALSFGSKRAKPQEVPERALQPGQHAEPVHEAEARRTFPALERKLTQDPHRLLAPLTYRPVPAACPNGSLQWSVRGARRVGAQSRPRLCWHPRRAPSHRPSAGFPPPIHRQFAIASILRVPGSLRWTFPKPTRRRPQMLLPGCSALASWPSPYWVTYRSRRFCRGRGPRQPPCRTHPPSSLARKRFETIRLCREAIRHSPAPPPPKRRVYPLRRREPSRQSPICPLAEPPPLSSPRSGRKPHL